MKLLNNILAIESIKEFESTTFQDSNLYFCKECTQMFNPSLVPFNTYSNVSNTYCPDCINRYSTVTEMCHCCEMEVEFLNKNEVTICPNCDNEIYPCSICDMDLVLCSQCKFDSNLTVDRAMKSIVSGHLVQDSKHEYLNIDMVLNHRLIG